MVTLMLAEAAAEACDHWPWLVWLIIGYAMAHFMAD